MYRQYENPWKVKKMLEEAQADLEAARQRGCDTEDLVDLYIEINGLKERLNFAWQDDEYDCEGGN